MQFALANPLAERVAMSHIAFVADKRLPNNATIDWRWVLWRYRVLHDLFHLHECCVNSSNRME